MGRPKKSDKTEPEPDESWYCPLCNEEVLDDDDHPQCEKCFFWFHLKCAGFNKSSDLPEGEWFCSLCGPGENKANKKATKSKESDVSKPEAKRSSSSSATKKKRKSVKSASEVEDDFDSSDEDVRVSKQKTPVGKKSADKTEKPAKKDANAQDASEKKKPGRKKKVTASPDAVKSPKEEIVTVKKEEVKQQELLSSVPETLPTSVSSE
jgi:hypothetical protein